MANTAFTRNYTDHSNNQGYQFEFQCDKCGNGFRSSFQQNKLGTATTLLDTAAGMFGGILGQAASAGNALGNVLRGKAWDDAFAAAINEIKPKFRQCTRCGHWVCPEVCWNPSAALCKACAPDFGEEKAAAQADALRFQVASQMHAKAASADLVGQLDISKQAAGACPHCGARAEGGKFCGSCGKPLAGVKAACKACKAEVAAGAKFCPQCGASQS
jgi:hypothetical protein